MVQSNRFFVDSMIITEKYVQLYVFCRSGVYHSRNFDIHKQAADFVRFILGVSSPDDSVVGFDKKIYWQGKQRVLEIVDQQGVVKKYNLKDKKHF